MALTAGEVTGVLRLKDEATATLGRFREQVRRLPSDLSAVTRVTSFKSLERQIEGARSELARLSDTARGQLASAIRSGSVTLSELSRSTGLSSTAIRLFRKELTESARVSSTSFRSMLTSASAFGSFIGTLGANVAASLGRVALNAVRSLARGLSDLVRDSARISAIETSFRNLTSAAGQSADAMVAITRSASKNLISDLEIMEAANKALLLGLPATSDEMGTLAETAVVLGRAMGQDASKSLDDLITALGRSSPLILDNLGLSVKLGEANEKMAASLGKSSSALTDSEKKLAFYRAALEAARQKVAEVGGIQLTLADRIQQASTTLQNFLDELAKAIARSPELARIMGRVSEAIENAFGKDREATIQRLLSAIESLARGLLRAGEIVIKIVGGIASAFSKLPSGAQEASIAFAALGASTASLNQVLKTLIGLNLASLATGLGNAASAAGRLANTLVGRVGLIALLAGLQVESVRAAAGADTLSNRLLASLTPIGMFIDQAKRIKQAIGDLFGSTLAPEPPEPFKTTLPAITDEIEDLFNGNGPLAPKTARDVAQGLGFVDRALEDASDSAGSLRDGARGADAALRALVQNRVELLDLNRQLTRDELGAFGAFDLGKMLTQFSPALASALKPIDALVPRIKRDFGLVGDDLVKSLKKASDRLLNDPNLSFGQILRDQIEVALDNLAPTVLQALTGGGDIGRSVGGLLGGAIGKSLQKPISAALSKAFGSTIGGALGSVLPGVGTVLGSLGGGLIDSAIGKLTKREGRQVNDLRDQFVAAAGGLHELNVMAKEAGVTLDAFLRADSVKEYERAIADLQAAFAKAEEEAKQFASDLQRISQQGELASGGVLQRLLLGKDRDAGAVLQFMQQQAQQAIGGIQKFLEGGTIRTAGGGQALGASVAALFQELQRQGATAAEALRVLDPVIDGLKAKLKEAGVTGGAAFNELKKLSKIANDEIAGPAIDAVLGLGQALTSLQNLGLLNQDTFSALAGEISATFADLEAQGKGGEEALKLMQPALQKLFELQQEFGFTVDESTQKLLDQAEASGLIGDQFKSAGDKMLDAVDALIGRLDSLITALGGDLPSELNESRSRFDRWASDASASVDEVSESVDRLNFGSSPGGLKEIPTLLDAASERFGVFVTDATAALSAVKDETDEFSRVLTKALPEGFDLATEKVTEWGNETGRIFADIVEHPLSDLQQALIDKLLKQLEQGEISIEEFARRANDVFRQGLPAALQITGAKLQNVDGLMEGFLERLRTKNSGIIGNLPTEIDRIGTSLTGAGTVLDRFADRARKQFRSVAEEADRLNFGASPGGLKEIPILLTDAQRALDRFAAQAGPQLDTLGDRLTPQAGALAPTDAGLGSPAAPAVRQDIKVILDGRIIAQTVARKLPALLEIHGVGA